jgi:hypothetical protein
VFDSLNGTFNVAAIKVQGKFLNNVQGLISDIHLNLYAMLQLYQIDAVKGHSPVALHNVGGIFHNQAHIVWCQGFIQQIPNNAAKVGSEHSLTASGKKVVDEISFDQLKVNILSLFDAGVYTAVAYKQS